MNINMTLLMQAAVFFAFIIFTAKFIWPPLMRAIAARQKEVADGLMAGEQGKQSLASAEKHVAEMLTQAKTQASEIVAQGEKLKTETLDQAKREAREEAERILTAARAEVGQEVSRAREVLRGQVADLAVAGASKILQREVDAKAHADLLASLKQQL